MTGVCRGFRGNPEVLARRITRRGVIFKFTANDNNIIMIVLSRNSPEMITWTLRLFILQNGREANNNGNAKNRRCDYFYGACERVGVPVHVVHERRERCVRVDDGDGRWARAAVDVERLIGGGWTCELWNVNTPNVNLRARTATTCVRRTSCVRAARHTRHSPVRVVGRTIITAHRGPADGRRRRYVRTSYGHFRRRRVGKI